MPALLSWQALGEKCSPNSSHVLGSLSALPFPDWELCWPWQEQHLFTATGDRKIRNYWFMREINKDKGFKPQLRSTRGCAMKSSSGKEFSGEKPEFLHLLLDVPLSSRLVLEDSNCQAVGQWDGAREQGLISELGLGNLGVSATLHN